MYHEVGSMLATLHLLGLKRPPWLIVGLVLGVALLSRSMVFLCAMLRHKD